ncbi:MAG: SDR family oxidoreductase [Oceanospirillaceae bacterium]|nr:SDR family oxidoreductase [Oceanospirillaceae bacterium]
MELTATYPDLMDKSVFITGGGAGIGAFLTEGFLAQGAKVSFVQRSNASEFVAQMKAKYKHAPLAIACDITDIDALQAAMDKAAAAHGVISVVVNNAGDDTRHSLAQTSVQAWDLCQHINLRPHFFTAQKAAPGMAKNGGSIINVSSVSYMMGNEGYPGYVAANAGINGLTRALARELGPQNIRVNSLMPGWVMTDKQLKMWATPESMADHLQKQCLKTHLKPEDVVGATLFLASNTSRMMTGQAMVVDGGVVVTG